MQLNPNIILAGQQQGGNVMDTIMGAVQTGAALREMKSRNALDELYAEHGPGIVQGNQESLNALARVAPREAIGVRNDMLLGDQRQHSMEIASSRAASSNAVDAERINRLREQGRMETLRFAQELDQASLERERDETMRDLRVLGQHYANGDEEAFASAAERLGSDIEFSMFPEAAAIAEGGLEVLDEAVERAAGPEEPAAMQTLRARAEEAGLQPETPEYQQFMREGGRDSDSMSMSFDPESGVFSYATGDAAGQQGQLPTDPNKLGFELSKNDADALKAAQEQAANADALAANLVASEEIVEGGFDSGVDSGVRAAASRVRAATGLGGGEYAAEYDQFQSVSKEIGMDQLRAIGGNDTERELLTAIQTTASTDKEPEANRRILQRKLAAIDVITQKPTLMQEWVRRYGSTSRPNEDGQSWSEAWREYQLREFREGIGAPEQTADAPLNDNGPWPIDIDPPPDGMDPHPGRWLSPEEREGFR